LAAFAAAQAMRLAGADPLAAVAVSAAAGAAVGLWSVRGGLAELVRERRLPVGEPAPCR
ncbi:hypothetical protein G3573_21580, partial [Caulobacter sp. 17J65-9]|nr:hypothetical protein [Caulobacter sp. 17J65-9]